MILKPLSISSDGGFGKIDFDLVHRFFPGTRPYQIPVLS